MGDWTAYAASQAGPAGSWTDIAIWSGILIGLLLVGVFVGTRVRRLLSGPAEEPIDGFTLHGLRTMHASGELTDEEYDQARKALIARIKGTGTPAALPTVQRPDNDAVSPDEIDDSDDDGDFSDSDDETPLR